MLKTSRSISRYLALAVAIAVGAILSFTWYAANMENATSLKTQKQIAQYVTGDVFNTLGGKLTPMVYWQDAYDKTIKHWDQKWVAYQFGPYLDSMNINVSLLFDGAEHIKFFYQTGLPGQIQAKALSANRGLTSLVAAVQKTPKGKIPVLKSGVVDIDNVPFFAVAARITPETESKAVQAPATDIIAVFLLRATAKSYEALQASFGISNVRLADDSADRSNSASIPLKAADGVVVTRLWWKPERPGDQFFSILAPFILVILILLVLVQALVVQRWQALQRDLYRAESKASAAEAESKAKTAFLGVLSHELRTPLNAIIGFTELVQSQIFGPLGSSKYAEYLTLIHKGGRNMLRIVNDLLHIAQIEANGISLVAERTDLNALLETTVQSFGDMASQKGVTLTFEPSDGGVLAVHGGSDLESVFAHLIENAVKFSKNSGTVIVSLHRDAGFSVVEVRDDGIGIKPDDIEILGRPFVQVEGHLARRNGGLGLGLVIVKSLVALMGGRFDIASIPGQGTTVRVTLPTVSAVSVADTADVSKAA